MVADKPLPENLRPYFWDYPSADLSMKTDRALIIQHILTNGSWNAIRWLRKEIGYQALKKWLVVRHGRGLSPRQIRFWALILNLPTRQVNVWVKAASEIPWGNR